MKKSFYILTLLLSIAIGAYSQFEKEKIKCYEPDTISVFSKEGELTDKVIYTYNKLGLKTSEMKLIWNKKDNDLVKNNYNIYSYNDDCQLERKVEQYWDSDNNKWINSYQDEFEYVANNLVRESNSVWNLENNMFEKNSQTLYVYDKYNSIIKMTYYLWDLSAEEWTEKYYYNYAYSYDANFNILLQIITSSLGSDTSMYQYAYDSNGYKISEKFAYTSCSGEWFNYDSITYLYDAHYNLIKRETKIWNDDSAAYIHPSWDGRATYTYDDNNNRISYVREIYNYHLQEWQFDSWKPKLEWTYENDNAVHVRVHVWDSNSQTWLPSTTEEVDVYYNNMQSSFEANVIGCNYFISYVCVETVDIIKNKNTLEIQLYPNPSDNQVCIKGVMADSRLFIYDYTGKFLQSISIDTNTKLIDISSLANGMYLFVITNSLQKMAKKILKQSY